jgi:hypothetical protein
MFSRIHLVGQYLLVTQDQTVILGTEGAGS